MKRTFCTLIIALVCTMTWANDDFESDRIPVDLGDVVITHIGHGTLMFTYGDIVIHIDPVSAEADYESLPDADIVLVTHGHRDHLDAKAILEISSTTTVIVHSQALSQSVENGHVLSNGEAVTVQGVLIEAVPAYNTTRGRSRFHPVGRDNGYILTLGERRFYIAGDTEDTPEMLDLEDIYVAFLPVNQPYTMKPEQVARAAMAFRPEILYPYHYGNTDVSEIEKLLAGEEDIEIRIRDLR